MGAGGSSNTAGANEQQKFERSLRAEGGDDAKPRWSLSRKSSSKKTRIAAYAAADAPQAAPAEASARAAAAEPPSAASEADAEERAQAAEALLFEAMMEEKRERCRQLVRKMSRQAGYNFIVGTDGLIVYSSNIFAIAALRAFYTLIARAVASLPYLRPAVALILGFVGLKMGAEYFHVEIPTTVSLGVIAALLGGGIGLSLLERRRERASS